MSSAITQLQGYELYNEIVMLHAQNKGVILVEGPADVATVEPHVDMRRWFVLPGTGKTPVRDAIQMVDRNLALTRVLAILDADWTILGEEPVVESDNVVYTDRYDFDATIVLDSNVVERLVSSLGHRTTVASYLENNPSPNYLSLLIPVSAAIGALRLTNHRQDYGISTREFPVHVVMDWKTGRPDIDRIVRIAIDRSPEAVPVDQGELASTIRRELDSAYDPLPYCSGHDLLAAFSTLMRQKWGSHISSENLEKAVRGSFSCQELSQTRLYGLVSAWSSSRSYAVWKCEVPRQRQPSTES